MSLRLHASTSQSRELLSWQIRVSSYFDEAGFGKEGKHTGRV